MPPLFSRVMRESDFEGWMVRCHGGTMQETDAVIIRFQGDRTHLYLLSNSQERLDDEAYLDAMMGLVHDLSAEFCVDKILLKKPASDFYISELRDIYVDT